LQCQNNLKQIGIASHSFHDAKGYLPPQCIAPSGTGVTSPDGYATWAVVLLPYIEQGNVYNQWNLQYPYSKQSTTAVQQQLSTYLCPARQIPILSSGDSQPGGLSDYAACSGSNDKNGAIIDGAFTLGTDAAGVPIITTWTGQLRLPNITDGTSSTTMFGEKHIRPTSLRGKNEDRSVFVGGNQNCSRRLIGLQPDGSQHPLRVPQDTGNAPFIAEANQSFGGPHSGVCLFVFCDGSVRSLSVTLDLTTLASLGTRAGGETLSNY